MATLTSKLKLSKPDYNDVRDIKVLNNNADLIDKFATDILGLNLYPFQKLILRAMARCPNAMLICCRG